MSTVSDPHKPPVEQRTSSLRRRLLLGILIPVGLLLAINAASLYREARGAINTAYDRTLLASAKSIGELLDVKGYDDTAELKVAVPYAALEAFEADNQSRMFYRISTQQGEMVSGFAALPFWRGQIPAQPSYSALVDFYYATYQDEPVRMAVLLQPVVSDSGRTMAVVQVAESLELRQKLIREILLDTLWHQALLMAVVAIVVALVVQRATRPVRLLSDELSARKEDDLQPLQASDAPRELQPLIAATNQLMQRLDQLLQNQKRFVRDASHQLRTPLAVLKVQVQSALRGDVAAQQALQEINDTVSRAIALANQMLALAKVEQLRQQGDWTRQDLAAICKGIALDLSPLISVRNIEFDFQSVPTPVRAPSWMLRELVRNLLHNAIRHTPHGGQLSLGVTSDAGQAVLVVSDSGEGIEPALRSRLFQPFAVGERSADQDRASQDGQHRSGLGLAICRDIVHALGGEIVLINREHKALDDTLAVAGLDATVRLPLDQNLPQSDLHHDNKAHGTTEN